MPPSPTARREAIKRRWLLAVRFFAYGCFGFCASVSIFFGLLLVLAETSSINPEALGAVGMMAAILLPLPTGAAALLGVVLSLILRKPRGLPLLAGLTVLESIFLVLVFSDRLPIDWTANNLIGTSSLLVYGFIALGVSGRLWFYQVFRAPWWEQPDDQEPPSLPTTQPRSSG